MKLTVDAEFRGLIPPLSEEEYSQLKANLLADGCRDPLAVWGDIILDGHNRYEICTDNDLAFNVVEFEFDNRQEAIEWIIRNQFGRRNLTPFQRAELALKLKPVFKEQAKEKQVESGGAVRQKSDKPPVRVDEALGKVAGVSRDTIRKTETILENGTEEDIADVRSGKVSISKKEAEIKGRDKPVKTEQVDNDPSQMVVIDNVLKGTLFEVWKTLNGVEQRYAGKMLKSDEKELKALLKKIQCFIDKKGGTQYEKSE